MRGATAAALALPPALALALLAGGCGIEPGDAVDVGPPPVIRAEPTLMTVYLLRDGRLEPSPVSASSGTVEDVLAALFKASEPPPTGMHSALTGFVPGTSDVTTYGPRNRRAPDVPTGLRIHVYVRGDRELTRAGLAQITCTAMLDKDIWGVRITQLTAEGSRPRGEHVCSEFRDLAGRDTQLPP